ncbi:hypothetical protein QR685DRAFT_538597 [Neurospora intermedia]|uniref:Uncharacterized protein n=1 Tax=Neurospora intermedia TaxID=5142 RepID=A0ABR3CY73_NEUIN
MRTTPSSSNGDWEDGCRYTFALLYTRMVLQSGPGMPFLFLGKLVVAGLVMFDDSRSNDSRSVLPRGSCYSGHSCTAPIANAERKYGISVMFPAMMTCSWGLIATLTFCC